VTREGLFEESMSPARFGLPVLHLILVGTTQVLRIEVRLLFELVQCFLEVFSCVAQLPPQVPHLGS